MSTVAALSSDLSSLISESKRRNSEIKHATEYSLNILKKYNSNKQSETEFMKQLTQEPNFITPFILSCQSRNAKFSTIAIHCLQRLISARGLPLGSLENILDSLIDASHLPLEIQLKVLQLLPTIYQAFGNQMNDKLISKLLYICAVLQGPSKPAVVVNTAAATLQQLIIFIFDKVQEEDKLDESEIIKSNKVEVDNNKQVEVSDNVYDCYRIFDDLCSLIEHHKPHFLQFNYLTETFLLELIESIFNNFTSVFIKHNELGYLLRFRITPILLRSLSIPAKEFSVVVRIARIIYLLIRKNLQILKVECEIVISLLNHMILNDSEASQWKKIIVLEIFNGIFQNFDLVEAIFKEYDYNNDRKHVLNDFLINCFCLIDSDSSKKLMQYRSVLHAPITLTNKNIDQPNTANTTFLPQEFIIDISPDIIPYMEMLDKTEPPTVPENYLYYLILSCSMNFVEGIGKYVMELSLSPGTKQTENKHFKFLDNTEDIESPTLKAEVLFSQSIIQKNYKVVLSTFEVFLYSKLSNECFHNLIRSLQKLCYSSGILGLELPRNDIIMLFAVSSINNTENRNQSARASIDHNNETGQDKIPSKETKSFGESLFGSISSKFTTHANNISSLATSITKQSSSGQLLLHSRYINSRHIITLRALINLGISLGPSLGANWKNIFIALQWVNYYLHGPPEDFKFSYQQTKYGTLPIVKQNEIVIIQNSVKKLLESLKDYLLASFLIVLRNLIELSDNSIVASKDEKTVYESITNSVFESSTDSSPSLSPCYYNKQYYLDLLGTISKLSSYRFLAECVEDPTSDLVIHEETKITSLKVVFNYLIDLSTNRDIPKHYRIDSASIFNAVLKEISKEAFANNALEAVLSKRENLQEMPTKVLEDTVEYKLLNSMFDLLVSIRNLQSKDIEETVIPNVSVVNCEFEIVAKTLENLRDFLDMFGVYFHKNSWLLVFQIIDLTFDLFNYGDANQSYGVVEKKSNLIKLGFEISQLILSDFLTVLPLHIARKLINSIYNFASQGYDINISFSAISYFWQISDYIRDLLTNKVGSYAEGNKALVQTIKGREDLIDYVENHLDEAMETDEQRFIAYSSLWIYLLGVLVSISNNQKGQVRNGSIQTFFRIIDSHGKHLSSWDLCYNIVISSLFNIRPKILKTVDWQELAELKQEWSETLVLVMNGIVKFYSNYFSKFENLDLSLKYWKGLIDYFEDVLKLGWNNCDLKLYEALNELLNSFIGKEIPHPVINLLFDFWANKNVSYNVTLNKHYQESLTSSMKSFIPLVKILGDDLDKETIRSSLKLFNSAVKYPILPTFFNDNVYPTDLQKSVLDNLQLITNTEDVQVQSDVILQLISNVVLPFSTRMKIKDQLSKTRLPKDTKISTFVSLSHHSAIILDEQIRKVKDFKALIQNKCVIKVISSLLEPIKLDAKGIKSKKSDKKELWIMCVDIILYLCDNIINLIAQDNLKNDIDINTKEQIWYLVVELYKTTLTVNSNNFEFEQLNVKTLDRLKHLILPLIALESFPDHLLDSLASYILDSSYVYEKDEIELSLLEETSDKQGKKIGIKDPAVIVKKFSTFDFDKHIPLVKPLKFMPRYKINLICLNDLIELSKIPTESEIKEIEKAGEHINFMDNIHLKSKNLVSAKLFPCLMIRASYILRKFISNESLVNKIPLTKIQKLEMVIVLKGLNDLLENFNQSSRQEQSIKYQQLSTILPLVIKTIHVSHKVRGVSFLIELFFQEYNENLKSIQ